MVMAMEQEAWATNFTLTQKRLVDEPANANEPKYVVASAIVIHDYAIFLIINKFPQGLFIAPQSGNSHPGKPALQLACIRSESGG